MSATMPVNHAVIIAGAPRSGTTWVAELLSTANRASYVHEPDNHALWPLALLAKQRLGRHPALLLNEPAPRLDRLWDLALGGAKNDAKP
ncbi:MAG: sulfotransferase domain-containing protein, partial [Acidimicrobiales bacterium]